MRARTRIAKFFLGRDAELYECGVCGKLNTKISDHTWHVRECIVIDAARRNIDVRVPSFR